MIRLTTYATRTIAAATTTTTVSIPPVTQAPSDKSMMTKRPVCSYLIVVPASYVTLSFFLYLRSSWAKQMCKKRTANRCCSFALSYCVVLAGYVTLASSYILEGSSRAK